MTMRELVLKNRSYRRFHQEVSVDLIVQEEPIPAWPDYPLRQVTTNR